MSPRTARTEHLMLRDSALRHSQNDEPLGDPLDPLNMPGAL